MGERGGGGGRRRKERKMGRGVWEGGGFLSSPFARVYRPFSSNRLRKGPRETKQRIHRLFRTLRLYLGLKFESYLRCLLFCGLFGVPAGCGVLLRDGPAQTISHGSA